MTPETELLEAAEAFTAILLQEAGSRTAGQKKRDKELAGPARKILKLAKDRFRQQRKSVLGASSLRKIHATAIAKESLREATDEERRAQIEAEISAAVSGDVHGVPVGEGEIRIYASAIGQAIASGASEAATQMEAVAVDTESFIAEYLKDGGFTRLTGDIDTTTVSRIASAVADSYEAGASFDETVRAIQDVFSEANSYRAKMIAQTELNDAYNQSIVHFAAESGAEEKWWETDAAPCAVCLANALQGRIPIDAEFESGDDAPTAHPNCLCSLGVGARISI